MSCNDSVIDKHHLHTEFKDRLNVEGVDKLDPPDEDEMEFCITREVFSEYRSSMFTYESPVPDRKLKRDSYSSPNLQKNVQLSVNQSWPCFFSFVTVTSS